MKKKAVRKVSGQYRLPESLVRKVRVAAAERGVRPSEEVADALTARYAKPKKPSGEPVPA